VLDPRQIDLLICAVLRGERSIWQWGEGGSTALDLLLKRSHFHGVTALLHSRHEYLDGPIELGAALRREALQHAIWELRHRQLVAEALQRLTAAGIEPVLFKGTALAYSLYPNPALRARGDTDLIVPPLARQSAHDQLVAAGWQLELGVRGEFVSYQANYVKQVDGAKHAIDLHWRINNSELLSRLFTYAELRQDAISLAGLGPGAFGPSPVHSLLVACMHRATHRTNPFYVGDVAHHTSDRLIWLMDIDLLARRLTDADWQKVLALARVKGLCGTMRETLRQVEATLHTPLGNSGEPFVAASDSTELASLYLASGKLRQQWMDFRALGSTRNRLHLARELLLPSATYMRSKFRHDRAPLYWLYVRRAVSGAVRRMGMRPTAPSQETDR
jgi:hypothetical protein